MGQPFESKEASEAEWREALSHPHYVTTEFLQIRNNVSLMRTPLESYQHLVATPHTSHSQYSEIETVRMKVEEKKRIANYHPHQEERSSFRYPHRDFIRFAPNLNKFYRVPTLKMPSIRYWK